jgi:hypothetical protein
MPISTSLQFVYHKTIPIETEKYVFLCNNSNVSAAGPLLLPFEKDGTHQVRDLPLTNSIAITMHILGIVWFCRIFLY